MDKDGDVEMYDVDAKTMIVISSKTRLSHSATAEATASAAAAVDDADTVMTDVQSLRKETDMYPYCAHRRHRQS